MRWYIPLSLNNTVVADVFHSSLWQSFQLVIIISSCRMSSYTAVWLPPAGHIISRSTSRIMLHWELVWGRVKRTESDVLLMVCHWKSCFLFINRLSWIIRSRYISVNTGTRVRVGRSGVWISAHARDLCLLYNFQTYSREHPAFYSMGALSQW